MYPEVKLAVPCRDDCSTAGVRVISDTRVKLDKAIVLQGTGKAQVLKASMKTENNVSLQNTSLHSEFQKLY